MTDASFFLQADLSTLEHNGFINPSNSTFCYLLVSNLKIQDRASTVHNMFWKRWKKEYLNVRPKWNTSTNNDKLGSLTLIAKDNLPPQDYGREAELHPGEDNWYKTTTGTRRRQYTHDVLTLKPRTG
ncbi:uncharacterized protein LOC108027472 isoform X2 [Drosophila biarmipes]|uniref:uncharacterized protein LOC108027472 isoform X2 n=1 Tax=Drosophila biarmipes TaxID=125945 RepID=UPI0007E8662F|nr:uncharacterized protein LOC108027472 isoform X2 [Drosophila biarmipes]